MAKNKETKQTKAAKQKNHITPGDIKGKIDVKDNRERRDGPGGN